MKIEIPNLKKHQKEILEEIRTKISNRDKQRVITIKSCRQLFHKSTTAMIALVDTCLNNPGSVNIYVAPKYKICQKQFLEVTVKFRNVIKSSNGTQNIIHFNNDSRMVFLSAGSDVGLLGQTATHLLVIDEAALITDDDFYMYLLPYTIAHKALIVLVSTPRYRQGFFYDYYLRGLE